eukprot:Awhi_evm1s14058
MISVLVFVLGISFCVNSIRAQECRLKDQVDEGYKSYCDRYLNDEVNCNTHFSAFCEWYVPIVDPSPPSNSDISSVSPNGNVDPEYCVAKESLYILTTDTLYIRRSDNSLSICAQGFVHARDSELLSNGVILVTDELSNVVYHISPNCGIVTILLSGSIHGSFVGQPRALAIKNNPDNTYTLYVNMMQGDIGFLANNNPLGEDRQVYEFLLDTDGFLQSWSFNVLANEGSRVHGAITDVNYDHETNQLFGIESDKFIVIWDSFEWVRQPEIVAIVDMRKLAPHSQTCGKYYVTADDNNAVFECTDISNPDSCAQLCPVVLMNPWAVATGVDCSVYTAGTGNSLIYKYNNANCGDPETLLDIGSSVYDLIPFYDENSSLDCSINLNRRDDPPVCKEQCLDAIPPPPMETTPPVLDPYCPETESIYVLTAEAIYIQKPDGSQIVCVSGFVAARDMELLPNGKILVVDEMTSTIFIVEENCGPVSVLLSNDHYSFISQPRSLTVKVRSSTGELLVFVNMMQIDLFWATSPEPELYARRQIYCFILNPEGVFTGELSQMAKLEGRRQETITSVSFDKERGILYGIENDKYVVYWNKVEWVRESEITQIVDMRKVAFSEGTQFIAADDNNDIFRCVNISMPETCSRSCPSDPHLKNPWAVSVGVENSIYSASSGGNEIIYYNERRCGLMEIKGMAPAPVYDIIPFYDAEVQAVCTPKPPICLERCVDI